MDGQRPDRRRSSSPRPRLAASSPTTATPVQFLYDNLAIALNVIHAAAAVHVEKLLFLGSSCIYPKFAPQPIGEDALLTGPLEPTNEWYAVAKIAGLKLCQAYRRQLSVAISSPPCRPISMVREIISISLPAM